MHHHPTVSFSIPKWFYPPGVSAALSLTLFSGAAGAPVRLAAGGKAQHAVVVGQNAAQETRVAAEELADYLGRIAGAKFAVQEGDGSSGIAVGVPADFATLPFDPAFKGGPFGREDYLLRSHEKGLWILGATPLAVSHAVWDFLYRLGYRQFFPTQTWEIVPHLDPLEVALDVRESPDFITRQAPRGASRITEQERERWRQWHRRNRVTPAFTLSTGHAYERIIQENRAEFEAHPEYFAQVNGKREHLGGSTKFCISNPGLRRLVVDYAVRFFRQNPDADSISMEPSDGGNWCTCDACVKMGSVSDRALTLANEVAEAINALGLGDKYVGMYAYNLHSPPPTIKVHPKVIISVATSFIRGGYTVQQLVEGWRAQGATLGIREYHDVHTWSRDMPRRARGGDIPYLKETIPYFYAQGARFMNSENSDSWGANGLGYYLSTRFLWDIHEVERADELIEDFLEKCFGPAKEPMRRFYTLINLDKSLRSSEDVIARMYRCVDEARRLTNDPAIRARLKDLLLYTRYVELYDRYETARGEERQKAFEAVVRHCYRMRDTMMVSWQQAFLNLPYRDRTVVLPAEAQLNVPEGQNPWKSSQPFDEEELESIVKAGIASNQVADPGFAPVEFSEALVPANPLRLPAVAPGEFGRLFRGTQTFYTWLPPGGGKLTLTVSGGHIYQDRGTVKIRLLAKGQTVAQDESVAPDQQAHPVVLQTPSQGLHLLEWSDGSAGTQVAWPEGTPMTLRSSLTDPARLEGRWSLYFYVPKGTTVVGGYASSSEGRLLDGDGRPVFTFSQMKRAGYFRVPVPPGQDGRLWKLEECTGLRLLMTVPPYLARSEKELLLPSEVVERDARPK